MVWRVPSSMDVAGIAVDLGEIDNAIVTIGVTIKSSSYAIRGFGSNHDVRIYGTVEGGNSGVFLGDDRNTDISNDLLVYSTGKVIGGTFGAAVYGGSTHNQGLIQGDSYGLIFDGLAGNEAVKIVNEGVISGAIAVGRNSPSTTVDVDLSNSGVLIGLYNGSQGADHVTNTGLIVGNVFLESDDDIYDGREGRLEGDVYGGNGNDVIRGGADANALRGEGDNDKLYGYAGNDTLEGGAGDDYLSGGVGGDLMVGGTGSDSYIVDNALDEVNEGSADGVDTVSSSITFSLSSTQVVGLVEALTLLGSGNIDGTGDNYANVIKGNNGNNSLFGMEGDDQISGGDSTDRLFGDLGKDSLRGGAGADQFVYRALSDSTTASSGRDTILDFTRGQGDKIDLSAIDADSGLGGNQAFDFIGSAAFSKTAGELRFKQDGGTTYLQADVDGNGATDFIIQFDVSRTFIATDFVL